jgi:hypothetical protein
MSALTVGRNLVPATIAEDVKENPTGQTPEANFFEDTQFFQVTGE